MMLFVMVMMLLLLLMRTRLAVTNNKLATHTRCRRAFAAC